MIDNKLENCKIISLRPYDKLDKISQWCKAKPIAYQNIPMIGIKEKNIILPKKTYDIIIITSRYSLNESVVNFLQKSIDTNYILPVGPSTYEKIQSLGFNNLIKPIEPFNLARALKTSIKNKTLVIGCKKETQFNEQQYSYSNNITFIESYEQTPPSQESIKQLIQINDNTEKIFVSMSLNTVKIFCDLINEYHLSHLKDNTLIVNSKHCEQFAQKNGFKKTQRSNSVSIKGILKELTNCYDHETT